MARIAVGGFQHETNTFAPVKADWADFVAADAWPGLVQGAAILPAVRGMNVPITGIVEQLVGDGHEIVPLAWAAAQPSAHVTRDAFERMSGLLLDALGAAGPVDGICLDLHGAMVCEHVDDGEGELLSRLRGAVGPDLPIAASLDLHANITPAMVDRADFLTAYRTYPHVDMAATGARAAAGLIKILQTQIKPAKVLRHFDFLIPLVFQSTMDEPARSLYADLQALESATGAALSFASGFPFADIADCGPSALACGDRAEDAVSAMFDAVVSARGDFAGRTWSPGTAVAEALRRARGSAKPVILADSADNPGAGATCGTVALLRELVEQGANGSVFGLLFDPEAAAAAHEAGEGTTLNLTLGGRAGTDEDSPLSDAFMVEKLGNGRFTGTGPFYRGARMALGPMALLRHGASGVLAAVASRKQQAADQAMFRHLGVEPARHPILALKSSVHYRADFEPIAAAILVVDGPGAAPLDPARLPFRKLRRGVRLGPSGPVFGA